jgi:hypothetical protein
MRLIGHAQRPIAASPARVWERLADVGGWKAWMPGVRWAVLERGLGAGGYVTIRPLRGRQTAYHVLVADAPRTLALGLTFGPVAGVCCTWTLVPDGFDTLVTETIEMGGPLGGWLAAGTADRMLAEAPALLDALAAALQPHP